MWPREYGAELRGTAMIGLVALFPTQGPHAAYSNSYRRRLFTIFSWDIGYFLVSYNIRVLISGGITAHTYRLQYCWQRKPGCLTLNRNNFKEHWDNFCLLESFPLRPRIVLWTKTIRKRYFYFGPLNSTKTFSKFGKGNGKNPEPNPHSGDNRDPDADPSCSVRKI